MPADLPESVIHILTAATHTQVGVSPSVPVTPGTSSAGPVAPGVSSVFPDGATTDVDSGSLKAPTASVMSSDAGASTKADAF